MTLERLSKRMKQLKKTVGDNSADIHNKIVIQSLTNIVLATPVREGIARANWNVQANAPDRRSDKEKKDPSGASTILAGAAKATGDNESYFISNSLDYIEDLNKGSSAQAPAGFVEAAVDTAVKSVVGKARLTK